MQNNNQKLPAEVVAQKEAYIKAFRASASSMVGKTISSVEAHQFSDQYDDVSIVCVCFSDGTVATFEANRCGYSPYAVDGRTIRINVKA